MRFWWFRGQRPSLSCKRRTLTSSTSATMALVLLLRSGRGSLATTTTATMTATKRASLPSFSSISAFQPQQHSKRLSNRHLGHTSNVAAFTTSNNRRRRQPQRTSLSNMQQYSTSNNNGNIGSSNAFISSTKSNTVKQFQTLLKKSSARMEQRQTIVEGPRIVTELFQNAKTRSLLRHVLISDDYQGEYPELEETTTTTHYQLSYVTPQVMKACTDTVTPQGIAALVDIPSSFVSLTSDNNGTGPTPIFEKNLHSQLYKHPLYLVLDGVSDPGNVGTLLRSSLAVGVAGIILLPECCDVWNPKAIRSAMGSTFYLPQILQVPSWEAAVSWLRDEAQVQNVYAATMLDDEEQENDRSRPRSSRPQNQAHFDIDWTATAPCALVIGSEGQGLNQDIRTALLRSLGESNNSKLQLQLQAVHVPMVADSIESLNAAVCGSVILFDYLRQTKKSPS